MATIPAGRRFFRSHPDRFHILLIPWLGRGGLDSNLDRITGDAGDGGAGEDAYAT